MRIGFPYKKKAGLVIPPCCSQGDYIAGGIPSAHFSYFQRAVGGFAIYFELAMRKICGDGRSVSLAWSPGEWRALARCSTRRAADGRAAVSAAAPPEAISLYGRIASRHVASRRAHPQSSAQIRTAPSHPTTLPLRQNKLIDLYKHNFAPCYYKLLPSSIKYDLTVKCL